MCLDYRVSIAWPVCVHKSTLLSQSHLYSSVGSGCSSTSNGFWAPPRNTSGDDVPPSTHRPWPWPGQELQIAHFDSDWFSGWCNLSVVFSSQERLFRVAVISEWEDELDFALRNRMPTVANNHIRNILDLETELQKLESWWVGLTLVESYFRQWDKWLST